MALFYIMSDLGTAQHTLCPEAPAAGGVGVADAVFLILQVSVEIFQNDIVDIGSQMAHGSVQQMQ